MHRRAALVCGLAFLFLYLYGLDRMGVYSADEPRYASIGREMARSGDLITPRLWGSAWFEKPALLYWMVAAGFRAGLGNDLAPRVPVALLSVAFLGAFFWILRREFGVSAAGYATAILGTSGGWLAISQVSATDLPMSAFFGLALLCTLPWLRTGDRRWLNGAAVALGLAFLAKSAPPLVLALPVLWFGRERWRDLFRPTPLLLFLVVAVPWYVACYLQNGPIFLKTLFWQHQIERFVSPSLQHVQPWYFYVRLLPLGFFPWIPILALLVRRDLYVDRRIQFLMATAAWGFVFFSASTNKLPFYLLPLLPPIAVVMGVALERASAVAGRVVIGLSAAMCALFPVLVVKLPGWMSRNPHAVEAALPVALIVLVIVGMVAVWFLRSRALTVAMVAGLAGIGYVWIKAETFPYIDEAGTARPVWRELRGSAACVKDLPRDWHYGLNYYADKSLPYCGDNTMGQVVVTFRDHRAVVVRP
jgi:4-amino-4-deoxy-L-arabinose transferase-like glycosyltransferase